MVNVSDNGKISDFGLVGHIEITSVGAKLLHMFAVQATLGIQPLSAGVNDL